MFKIFNKKIKNIFQIKAKRSRGMTVVEVVVAIAIFSILATVAYTIFIGTDNLVKRADQKSKALLLAEEGIEAARSIREESYVNLVDGTHGLSSVGSKWSLAGTSDVTDSYTRVLNIVTKSMDEKEVTVTVSWMSQTSPSNSVVMSTYLTNWHAVNYNAGLTVNKVVINHGGSKTSADFAPYQVGTSTVTAGLASQFVPGTYTVTEATSSDYTQTFSGDCNSSGVVNIVASSTNVCTITNEEKLSKIVVTKVVTNHGNSKVASDFTLKVDTNPVTSGALNTFSSGLHTVSEVLDPEYDATISGDCDSLGAVTLAPGITKNCTITNEEKLAYVSVYKNVVNHGGTKTSADFTPYKVGATTVTLGATTTKNSGTYTVSETVSPDYNQTFSGDCNSGGSITLVGGATKVCTITNEEKPANIIVNKTVTNHGSSKVAADFAPYKVGATTVTVGATTTLDSGTYNVSETPDSNYVATFSGDCNSSGLVTLVTNTTKVCSITNEEKVIPTIDTPASSAITSSSATLGATVQSLGIPAVISARGVCYSSSTSSPSLTNGATCVTGTLSQTVPSAFTISASSLVSNTLYYYRGYTTNSIGTAYTANTSFTTTLPNSVPTVTTPTVASITTITAVLGANVTSLGLPASITARGTCYGTTPNPVTNCVAEGNTTTGIFTHTRTGLVAGTTYYYRGYATNSTGTGYSADGTFTTIAQCVVLASLVGTPTIYDSAGSVSAVVTKPTGVTTNDIMFAHILHFNATDRLNTIPAGWLPIDATGRHKNGNYNQALYYKVATASEGANYTFGLSASSKLAVTISAYRGCFDPTNPIDASSNVQYVTNDTTYRAASLTLSNTNSTVLMFPSIYRTSSSVFANPLTQGGGWTEDYDHGNNNPDFWRAGYRKIILTSGATNVIDSIGTLGTTIKHAFAVGLHPL